MLSTQNRSRRAELQGYAAQNRTQLSRWVGMNQLSRAYIRAYMLSAHRSNLIAAKMC